MIMKTNKLLVLAALTASLFSACKKDEEEPPVIPNEEELITTLTYTLTPVGGGTPVVFSFKDTDGDGGNAPVVIEGILSANTDYTGVLSLLNESEDPAEDITIEVSEEGVDHQLFYQPEAALNMEVDYSDVDANGKPIGLSTLVSTGTLSSGNLVITLRHEPNKNAAGVSDGDITNAGGETDIEVTFVVEIE
jgi:hypothetical protein